jgi:hypothetical protein
MIGTWTNSTHGGDYLNWTADEMQQAWETGQEYRRGEICDCWYPSCRRQVLVTVKYCKEHLQELEYERGLQAYERRLEQGPDGDVVRLPSGEALEPCYCGDDQCFYCGA